MHNTIGSTSGKNTFIIVLFIISCIFCTGRLFYLQIILNEKMDALSIKNFTRFHTVRVPRGNITDTHGNLLATNRPVAHISWIGTGNGHLTPQQVDKLNVLNFLLEGEVNLPTPQQLKFTERFKKERLLAKDIPFDVLSKIMEYFSNDPNFKIETHFERYYPYKMLASHLVGYLGSGSGNDLPMGKMGLERFFQKELEGNDGLIETKVNAMGSRIERKLVQPSTEGQSIRTTLDVNLQRLAERIFGSEYAGSFILMDSYTGALKVLLSRPSFDPSIFLKPMSHDMWHELSTKQPFINRSYNAQYPPASLFKLVTITAGLEEGLITPESSIYCNGFIKYGNRRFRCNKYYGHGMVDIKDSIAHSCNIIFYEIGKKITINKLAEYANMFGLGKSTGFALAEKKGFIPTSDWKMQYKNERWWPGETISATIGQTFMLVTPLQITRMFASINTGYLVNPRILEEEPININPLPIKHESLEFLQESMKQVTEQGTAQQLNKIPDITIYAKTGTAQTSSLEKRKLGGKHVEHAWFIANFTYKDQNPLTLVILLEHAGYVRIATNMVKQFILRYKHYIDKGRL